jgi:hypothetical protein
MKAWLQAALEGTHKPKILDLVALQQALTQEVCPKQRKELRGFLSHCDASCRIVVIYP